MLPLLSARKSLPFLLLFALLALLFAVDVHHALRRAAAGRGKFVPESFFDGISAATEARVAIVRSDDAQLLEPASLDQELTYPQIEAMVRRAVELSGGLAWLIRPGDRVMLKPNIVDPEPPGTGETTDTRVVKAIALLVHRLTNGAVEILIGEGSPRPMDYEMEYADLWTAPAWEKLWDKAGYQDLLADPDLEGVNLRLVNLNGPWEDLVQVEIPYGGFFDLSQGKLWIHKEVLNADVLINVPVMKIHNPGITVALKNNIGLYPATRYGFSRGRGVPQDGYQTRLLHYDDAPRDWVEEQIVDINLVADVDFVVVDALMCLERSKSALRDDNGRIANQVRRNLILAGADPVAIDHVAARLMGQNPDDIAHLTLAAKAGLGNNQAEQIQIAGSTIEASWHPFKKDPLYTSDFGQGNRTWLLRGPFDASGIDAPLEHAFIEQEAELFPRAGRDGWTESMYFFDDRIDLGSFFQLDPGTPVLAYAFAFFDAPRDQEAELWIGSDEAVRVYINGQVAYEYARRRAFGADQLVKDRVRVPIRRGENTLLVKAFQELGEFDFALNICQPEGDTYLDGNRVFGLRFRTRSPGDTAVEETGSLPMDFALGQNYPNPFNASTLIPFRVPAGPPQEVRLEIYNLQGQRLRTLVQRAVFPGSYQKVWDGRDERGLAVASGAYLYCLRASDRVQARKMLLLR